MRTVKEYYRAMVSEAFGDPEYGLPPKLQAFIREAKVIAENSEDFAGPVNRAVFWAHAVSRHKAFRKRNLSLAVDFKKQFPDDFYVLDDLQVYKDKIKPLMSQYRNDKLLTRYEEAEEIVWSIFSEAFVKAAQGKRIVVAVNDAEQDDWFIEQELPILQEKYSGAVIALQPHGHRPVRYETFDKWLADQKKQWENPGHYLDGSKYPSLMRRALTGNVSSVLQPAAQTPA